MRSLLLCPLSTIQHLLFIVHTILHIATQLKIYENDLVLREAIVAMKSKYLKYWREISFLYILQKFVLDYTRFTKGMKISSGESACNDL